MNTPEELAQVRASQARAEAGAQRLMDFYESNAGVPAGTVGADPQPLPVTGDPAVTGVPWDQQ